VKELQTLDEIRRFVTNGAEQVRRDFTEPDDDWRQILFVQSPGKMNVLPMEIPPGADAKDTYGRILRSFVAGVGALRYAALFNTWQRALDMDAAESQAYIERVRNEEILIRDDPKATELLMLNVGDAEEEQLWWARILRHPDRPPGLASWERVEATALEGRFVGLNSYMRL
jgi:hypothetical protein